MIDQEVRMKRFYIFIITFAAAVLITGNARADVTYRVKKGDNPYTIAKKFDVSHEDIIKINAIDPHLLKPGTRLVIPSKKASDSQVTDSLHADDSKRKHPPGENRPDNHTGDEAKPSFHIVKKGETVSALSRKYTIPIRELMAINNMRSARLRIGQKIALNRQEIQDYTVRKGDTLWDIAEHYDISPRNLMAMNNLKTDLLKPGQKILLREDPPKPIESKNHEVILSQGKEKLCSQQPEIQDEEALGLSEKIVLAAKRMLNIPYRFGGNSLLGIDCSAYVRKVYSMIGIELPRSAREQFKEGTPIDADNLSIGDLVFFRTYASYPSHVGIYLGNNLFIHASSKKKKVTIDSLKTPFYIKRYIGAKRLLDVSAKNESPRTEG